MSLAYKISSWNRKRKWRLFWDFIQPTKEMLVLDVGFNDEEYSATDNYLEKNYPYPEKITALGLKKGEKFQARYPLVKTVVYSGGNFPFANNSFAVVWSNAVLEHVGSFNKQLQFLKELNRVANRGFITTPNKNFPVEIHTRVPLLHLLLPKNWFAKFLRLIGKEWATGDYMHLLSLSDLQKLLAEAGIKNYQIIKNKILFFTVDFVVVWQAV